METNDEGICEMNNKKDTKQLETFLKKVVGYKPKELEEVYVFK